MHKPEFFVGEQAVGVEVSGENMESCPRRAFDYVHTPLPRLGFFGVPFSSGEVFEPAGGGLRVSNDVIPKPSEPFQDLYLEGEAP